MEEEELFDEPETDDGINECPNCERAQQFPGLCPSCMEEMRQDPMNPVWDGMNV